ncbi:Nudix family hydrolase [Marinimicrobium agarilyticum]|uniref:Nudix family hydrolase n=1 Tax=Marinimicrobium agarilyticum TaxID=306546 RepID=UPI0003FB5043|nr:Nudix family hydrolase [Marinimicrobium agarilyticum]
MGRVVRVAVGVVQGPEGRILIARRADDAHQGGLWEFPGGKVDPGETLTEALARELREELAIDVLASEPLIEIRHDYPDKSVLLQVCRVTEFEGEPLGAEGQPVRWVLPEALPNFAFPAANRPIVNAIRLPQSLLITGDADSPEEWERCLAHALARGVSWVQVRAPSLSEPDYQDRLDRALALCRPKGVKVLAHGSASRLRADLDGVHFNSEALKACRERPVPATVWWGASCHSPEELRQAARLGVDYVTLSPVMPTHTHPEAEPLGWARFADWVAAAPMPVYALGGVTEEHRAQALANGGQGIAGIGFAWGPSH